MTVCSDAFHGSDITLGFDPVTEMDYIIKLDFLPKFPKNICHDCGMPTEDIDSFVQLVMYNFGTCMCSKVETNFSKNFLFSGLLNFKHPLVLLFALV